MAVIDAHAATPGIGGVDNQHLTVDYDKFTAEIWPPHVSDAGNRALVSLSSHHPVSQSPRTINTVKATSFYDDFYNRIHITPQRMPLGNILSTQASVVKLWNAHLESRTLISITGLVDGMTLDGAAAPFDLTALAELDYDVSVSQDGAATVDTTLRWTFDNDEAPLIRVTAARVFIWGWLPDWDDGVTERLEWLTDILSSNSLVEQRRAKRIAPRRTFSAQMYIDQAERQFLDLALFDWSARFWGLPIWPEVQLLTQSVALSALRIPCQTAYLEFRVGGLAILHSGSAFHCEGVVISGVDANGIDLASPLNNAWPVGTRLYPAKAAMLAREPRLKRLTDQSISADVDFLVMEACDWPEILPATLYRGWPVLETSPDESEDLAITQHRLLATLDAAGSLPLITDVAGVALPLRGWKWLGSGRQERAAFRSLVYGLRGRQVPVWIPTHSDDLTVVAGIGGTTVDVAYCGYTRFGQTNPGRRDIRIELLSGTVYHRRITGCEELSSTVERLQIDSSLGESAAPSQIRRVCWMTLSRLSSDRVEIEHITDSDGIATSSLTFRGVRDDAV